ncbi:MAG: hypothetical protein CMM61_06530 [Rhodospirillaceae bacterium]|nr:hypothetical protein [Rhodospirillaceae bacterium]
MRLEKTLSIFAVLAALTMDGLSASPARAAECHLPGVQPTVRLNESFGDIRYSNGYSGQQLAAKRRRAGACGGPGADWHPVGLMGRDLQWEFKVKVQGQRLSGGYCVGLAQAEMTIGYDRIRVYIDRRYRPGTCQYKVILEHENQHVRNFKDTLSSYLPVIRRQLAAEAAALPPVTARSMNTGARYFVGALRDRLTPLIDRMQADMAEADRRLDTPASYRATQARCDGW